MIGSDGAYRTDDMALASALSLAGYSYTLFRASERKAMWIFSPPEHQKEDFEDTLDEYFDGEHTVEPRKFIRRYTDLRSEVFRLMERPFRPVAPAADSRA